jgi:hypothetical protein
MPILDRNDWPEIARRYFRWLQPSGFCIVETINLGGFMGQDISPTRNRFEAAFQDVVSGIARATVYALAQRTAFASSSTCISQSVLVDLNL